LKIHILGICGTFMGGIALLARQAGHRVSGSDQNVYPPMSTQLEQQGIELSEGFHSEHIPDDVDVVVIGNAMSRGNEAVEYVLNNNIPYSSGPEWLAEHVLKDRWVLAVAGTHGKTTTSSMLAWLLEYAGLDPGFLIGGIPANFGLSARFGREPFFVVEADEYDTAFFDKRSKFVHYHPRTVVLNNLEFDHADIFEDLEAIKKQFHHLVRTIPGDGLIISNGDVAELDDVLSMGCWTEVAYFSTRISNEDWGVTNVSDDGASFDVMLEGNRVGTVNWALHGEHNRLNALAAIAAAQHAGVPVELSCEALAEFGGIKRRLEVRGEVGGVIVYDDFAHHPTAIVETLKAMQELKGDGRVFAILEPRSNTMRMGVHAGALSESLQQADDICIYQPAGLDWNMEEVFAGSGKPARVCTSTDDIIDHVKTMVKPGDHVLIMSNGGFEGIHARMIDALDARSEK